MSSQGVDSAHRRGDDTASTSDETSSSQSVDDGSKSEKRQAMFDKDSDEEELERLVLGDETGFKTHLFEEADRQTGIGIPGDDHRVADDHVDGLEDIADADLFVFDTGLPQPSLAANKEASLAPLNGTSEPLAAWEDSDDERLSVSLATATRLRKLRITEAEDIVSGAEYCRRLQKQYLRFHPAPVWANQSIDRPVKRRRRSSASSSSSSDAGSDVNAQPLDQFLRDVRQLAGSGLPSKRTLRPEALDIQRTRDIPDRHKMPVECLCFHPEFPVLLSASSASVLYLHHIAPDAQPPNPQLTSVQAKQVDIRRAEFRYPQGDKIFFVGRRRYFHHWHLASGLVQKTSRVQAHRLEHKKMDRFKLSPCGRYMAVVGTVKKGGGVINVLSTASMQWICGARLQGRHGIADFAWWSTGDGMTILGRDGLLGEYSVDSQSFVGLWHDDGCVSGTVVALGGHGGPVALGEDRWVAVGSGSGIANMYDRNALLRPSEELVLKERPTPTRTFEQLVTPITVLTFSPDGQLFAFGSRKKKDALRLVHLPKCTVYRNWPTQQTPLGRITALAFSRDSSILSVGNDAGKVRLWEIRS